MAEDIIQEGAAQTEGDKIAVEESKNTTTNNNFCAEINTRVGDEDSLAVYCKENGNLVLLDPAGAIPNNSVNQEDLVIYATLVARVKNKSLLLNKPDEVTTQINFVKGKDIAPGQAASVENETKDPNVYGLLTTNWTDIGSVNSQLGEDLETFGMTNIDINFNSGFMPIITIDFVDIRGATLFEQGTCSPYGAFFHQPYPVFELTIKGYYGQPVRYYLACTKFTTSFDASTGNYKSRGEFLGHSYAFLSDILLGYVMAAPYIEGSEDILGKIYKDYLNYYEEMGYNQGKTKFDPLNNKDGRPFTVFNYVKKIESLIGGGNSDQGAIAEIQNSTELGNIDDLDNLSNVLDDIDKFGSDFKEEWIELGGQVDGENYTYGVTNNTDNQTDVVVSSGRGKILDLYDRYYNDAGIIGVRIEAFNEVLSTVESTSVTTLQSSDFSLTNNSNSSVVLDLTRFNTLLRDKRGQIREELNKQRQEFKNLANARIKQAIGFIPTIRSFFTVLLANTELFLELLKKVSAEAEQYHQNNENDTFQTQCQDEVRVGGEEGVVWAWPTYFEKKPNGTNGSYSDVETYPGNNPKYANWPEVKFVEDFLRALQEMQKDITEEISGEDPSVDAYDDVPGRDNYFPINTMETPIAASDCNVGYYNLNSIDDVYRTLGERFIIASNVSSPNANNLNTSIIAAAKNKFLQWVNEDTENIEKCNTKGWNGNVKGVFHGLEYLNHGQLTPFFSAGAPFNPKKWGGKDESISNSLTWDKVKYSEIQNIEGYPYIDWASVQSGNIPRPMGMAGSSSVRALKRETSYSSEVQDLITNGGEINSFRNTSVNNISASIENRTNYYKISTDEILPNSPCSQKISDNGDPDIVVILEPLYYTKKVIYFWGGLESVISRDTQIAQIPNEIKDRYFIVFAAGTSKSKQNSLDSLKSAFKKLYSKDDYKRFKKVAQVDVNIGTEIDDFSSSYFGYSAGGYALFNNSTDNADFIGLVDPSIESGSSLTNGNKWKSSTRMVWGSAGMIELFTEQNYKSLQDTIKNNSGKSEKINGLNHGQAITKWFEKYGSDLSAEVNNIQEELVNKILNESVEAKQQPKAVEEKNINEVGEINKGSKWLTGRNSGGAISKSMYENWEFLGRAEAHNFYNAITNTTLVGSVITSFDNVSDIYKEVINSLAMDEEDIYDDPYLAVYRYDRTLQLNRVSKKRGGAINLLPDIHEMNASDLVRLDLIENVTELGGKEQNSWPVFREWFKNKSGRAGWGINEDSTYITSGVFDFMKSNYGAKPVKDTSTNAETKKNDRIVSLNSGSAAVVDLNSYTEFAFTNIGMRATSYGIAERGVDTIDGSVDENLYTKKSRFTADGFTVQDKFLTVDIYPDYEFNYLAFKNIFNETASDGGHIEDGDWNWKYARSIYEFNNPKDRKLWLKGLTYRSWHTVDWGGLPNVTKYNIDVLKVISDDDVGFGNFYKGLKSMSYYDGETSLLPYSTSYTPELPSVKEYADVVKENATAAWAVQASQVTESEDQANYLQNSYPQTITAQATVGDNAVFVNTNTYPTIQEQLDIPTLPPSPPPSPPPSVALSNEAQQYAFNETDFFIGYGVQNSKILYEDSNIISDTDIAYYSRYTKYAADKDAEDAPNANFLNVGGTLTETPFWRHNFPAKNLINGETNDSNVNKAYYSFWGGGYMNIADTTEYSAAGISKKLLYMGLKNDLDSYSDSSKFFPEGFSEGGTQGFYFGNVSDGKKTDIKYMLTNHNKDTVKVERNDAGEVTSTQSETNYNRTKAWKGALAYLFLANQYHKPWTGLYSSSLKNLGPQGTLGISSTTTKIPKHSVLLLGAVLWRMREAGLLESDNPRWNIEPEITNGTDPVNYPVFPEKIEYDGYIYDTLNYVKDNSNSDNLISYTDQNTITNESLWPTNHGVRPPQLSVATLINGPQGSALTFPRADEWPAPNIGMIYAYDFFGDKGVTNPFKNQKKIWTPIMANHNNALLRYSNQQVLWTTAEKAQAADFVNRVKQAYDSSTSNLKDYSDSAKASIGEELAQYAQDYIAKELSAKTSLDVFKEKGLLEQRFAKKVAGTDEGFTRFTALAHQLDTSFFYVGLARANGGVSYNKTFAKDTTTREAGRNFMGHILDKEAVSFGGYGTAAGTDNTIVDLGSEYVKNNAIEVEIKTFTELKELVSNSKFTKADGTVITVKQILAEVPYDEGTKPKTVTRSNEPQLFIKIGDDGESLSNNVQGSANVSIVNTPINANLNFLTPTISQAVTSTNTGQSNGSPYANTGDINTKNFLVRKISTNVNTDGFNVNSANWTSYWPQELESEGGYVNPGNNYTYTNTFVGNRYFNFEYYTDRSKEAQIKIALSNPGAGIDTNSDNLYHYIAEWSVGGTQYYGNLKAKVGRKFLILTDDEKPQQTQTGGGQQGLSENIQFYQELYKYTGYLRGYIPMGPEIWFMPTSVKKLFIEEFEKFVGDFNNFNNSEFDEILEIIDPLNFPTPQKTSKFAGIFEDELTYPNMFAEFGAKGTDAPYMLRVVTPNDQEIYGTEVDKNGVSKVPEPLIRWLNFYNYGTGYKSAKINGTEQNFPVVEQKTTVSGEANSAPYKIWSKLFDSYYIMGSTTPRTWWGEFPLEEDSNGNLVETTNKYFRFNKQELSAFLKGFADELNRGTIYNDYKQKIKDAYLSDISAESLGANQDDDIRLTIYRSMKSIYDKWISSSPAGKADSGSNLFYNPIGKGRLLVDHFSFVNRVNIDIGDKALVNVDVLQDLFANTKNSIFGVTSDILDSSNFNFFPLPSYVDLSAGTSLYSRDREKTRPYRVQAVEDMFRPISTQDYFSDILLQAGGPHFLCQYVGGNSQKLNLSVNKERGCLEENTKNKGRLENRGDSFTLDPEKGDCYQKTASDISEQTDDSKGVVGFKVKFGSETQSHFLGINLDQAEYKETLESLTALDQIANAGQDGGSGGFVAKGQSLYQLFLNRSYSCTVEALGNPMIQPLQYFELENVPMFYGSYLIRDVKHNIRPHSMKTTFTGDRVPYAVVPIVEDIISTFSIKPTQAANRTSLASKLGSGSSSGSGPCYENRTRTITRKAGTNYIIGDSKTPWLKKATTNTKVSLYNGGGLPNGGQSYLWESGKGVKWLTDAVNIIGPDDDVQSIIINIGANDNYNLNVDFNALVEAIKSKFTAAKLYAIQGAYNYTGSNKNKTLADVTAFYKKFEELGVKLIDPPVGDGTQFTKDGVATTENVHQQLDIYNTIMEKVNELVPEATGEETSVTITERVEVPCAQTQTGGFTTDYEASDGFIGKYQCAAANMLKGNPLVKANKTIEANSQIRKALITQTAEQVIKDWDSGNKKESEASQLKFLEEYSKAGGGYPSAQEFASNAQPWSAAFISYVMLKADPDFPFTALHYNYITAAAKGQAGYEILPLKRGYSIKSEVGDLFCNKRGTADSTFSHCDVVYKVDNDKAYLIGGNTSDFDGAKADTAGEKRIPLFNGYITDESNTRKYKIILRKTGNAFYKRESIVDKCITTAPAVSTTSQSDASKESMTGGDYGVSDYQLFTYLSWQQGAGGAAQHYSLWKNNGKKSKYTIPSKNIKQNWPGGYTAKNGLKASDVDTLYNNGINNNGNHNKLATAFVDVQRQLYAKKLKEGLTKINSNGKNRSGVPYSDIKAAFEKHQSGPECDFNSLVGFGMIENALNTDTDANKLYQTMFQMNSTYDKYKEVLNKLTKKKSPYKDNFQDWENIEVLTAAVIPRIKEQFGIFSRNAGFS